MRYLFFMLLVVSANAQPTPLGPVREGPVSVIPMGNGNNTGNSATNVVLTGDVTKSANSTATTISARAVDSNKLALATIETNNLSAAAFAWILSLQGGSQTPWTSDINANNKALTNLNYISGATASSNALMVQNNSGTAILQSRTNGDLVISGGYFGHGGGLTNLNITGSGSVLITTNSSGVVNILASNNVPVAGNNITVTTNAVTGGATYTIASTASGAGYITVQTNRRIFTYSAIGTTTPSALGTSLTIGGTGGGNLAVVPDNSNPARLRLYSGAAAGDDQSISDNNACFAINKPALLSWRFALTNTTNARAFAGMCSSPDNALQHDFLTTAGFINGFGFIFAQTNNSHWLLSSLQLSGNITNLATTIVADTSPHTFTIISSPSSVSGYIDGALVGILTTCYPVIGGGQLQQAVGISSSSTTAEGLEFVQFYGEQDF